MPAIVAQNTANPTVGELCKAAAQMLGYLAPNEELTAYDAALLMQQLGFMLDSWSNESLMCFAILEQNFRLQPGKNSYSIGLAAGADVAQVRPIRVLNGIASAYLQDENFNNYEVDVVTREQWNQIANRGPDTTSNIPDTLFYDPQFPLGILNLWPTPTIGYTLFFDSYQQFVKPGQMAQVVNLPPGYSLAIMSNLAVLVAPFLKGALVSNDVKAIAVTSKAVIKRSNKRDDVATYDREITSSGQPTYNIYSGRYQ